MDSPPLLSRDQCSLGDPDPAGYRRLSPNRPARDRRSADDAGTPQAITRHDELGGIRSDLRTIRSRTAFRWDYQVSAEQDAQTRLGRHSFLFHQAASSRVIHRLQHVLSVDARDRLRADRTYPDGTLGSRLDIAVYRE